MYICMYACMQNVYTALVYVSMSNISMEVGM